ncbi:MAG: hypothetical protein ACPGO3_03850 [Magnetospiraceae bacterium]
MPIAVYDFFAPLACALVLLMAGPAWAGGVITIDNQTRHAVKVAAPGGAAVVEPGGDPVAVTFETDAPIGLDVKLWWADKPLELCIIFTPWDRSIIVSGKTTISCRSL